MTLYKILLFILVVFMVCAFNQASAQEFVVAGLVSFWTFDKNTIEEEMVKDVWGTADGKIVGAKTVAGKINEGLGFDGSSTYVEIDEDENLDITDAMSIDAWINISSWELDPNRNVIMARYDQNQSKRYVQFALNPDNGLATYMGYNNGASYYQTQKGGRNEDWEGVWVHVAFTWDHSDGGLSKLYVDGQEITSYANQEALEEPLVPYDIPWVIGAMPGLSRYFNGTIDEVRIYNRRLTDDEIERNFNVERNDVAVDPGGKLAATWGRAKLDI